MLEDRRCGAMLPAKDVERAKSWYADKLDMKPSFENEGGAEYKTAEGTEFWIYPSEFAGSNKATAMGFMTKSLEKDMDAMRSRGITFEDYNIPGIKTENGIAEFAPGERGCWFKDSEGNIIAMFESASYNG